MEDKIIKGNRLIGADFSEDRKYRYCLWRIWNIYKPLIMFVGLNQSTANEVSNDPTIKSVCRIAKNNGYGGVYMMNCFPIIFSDPSVLNDFDKSIHDQWQLTLNDRKLREVGLLVKDTCFAWGNFNIVRESHRDTDLIKMFPNALCLHKNKNGSPKHPLYCKSESLLIPFINTQNK
jgi:hypothetical protein